MILSYHYKDTLSERPTGSLKWSALMFDVPWGDYSNIASSNVAAGGTADFESAVALVGVLLAFITLHAVADKCCGLPLALNFPTIEFYIAKIVFGALCVAAALVSEHHCSSDCACLPLRSN